MEYKQSMTEDFKQICQGWFDRNITSEKTYDEIYALYKDWMKSKPSKCLSAHKYVSDSMEATQSFDHPDEQYYFPFGIQFFDKWDNYIGEKYEICKYGIYFRNYMTDDKLTAGLPWYDDLQNALWKEYGHKLIALNYCSYLFAGAVFNLGSEYSKEYTSLKNDISTLEKCINNKQDTSGKKLKNNELKLYELDLSNAKSNLSVIEECIQITDKFDKQFRQYRATWHEDFGWFKESFEQYIEDKKNGNDEGEITIIDEIVEAPAESSSENQPPSSENTENTPAPNVFSSSDDNAYSSVSTNNESTQQPIHHTRIYQYLESTIELDEMSIPLFETETINNALNDDGLHGNEGQTTDKNPGVENVNGDPYDTTVNNSQKKANSIGISYPLLRINDHYYVAGDIKYFSLETKGFIPEIEVILECSYNDLLKENGIKDGDICSVFISPGHDAIKSYRGDFQITHVSMKKQSAIAYSNKVNIHFMGELFIPGIYNSSMTFSYPGTSRDALIDAAQKLGLGFFFSDADNTEDIQIWYSTADGDQKFNGTSTVINYIQETAKHSYKNFESFYDCWIDPRYAISFINIAQMLGGSGLDEEIDLAIFNSVMTLTRGIDGSKMEEDPAKKKQNPKPQLKMLTNIGTREDATTAFYVTSFNENINGAISNQLGLTNENYYSIQNSGIKEVEEGNIEMKYSIPVNADKLKNGYYIMAGPGKNLTYTSGDNGSYPDQHKSVQGGKIAETQADSDASELITSKSNATASGNTNKFYEVGEGHNTLNNMWLKKKTIDVTLNGCNLQVMRGEKIPMTLQDLFNPAINMAGSTTPGKMLYNKILPSCSGWFIIAAIKWVYSRDNIHDGTQWETRLTLTRREWPIPGYVKNTEVNGEAAIFVEQNYGNNSTSRSATNNNSSQSTSGSQGGSSPKGQQSNTDTAPENLPTSGLQSFMITIYNDIKNAVEANGGKINLISGRRWAADENGNRKDGDPTIKDGDTWKYVNAKGEVMWFNSKTSKHNTGEAIDIINGVGTAFDEIPPIIINDNKTMADMLANGVYCSIEATRDDTGNTVKHYHIGRVNNGDADSIKGQSAWWTQIMEIYPSKSSFNYNGKQYNCAQYLQYNSQPVQSPTASTFTDMLTSKDGNSFNVSSILPSLPNIKL